MLLLKLVELTGLGLFGYERHRNQLAKLLHILRINFGILTSMRTLMVLPSLIGASSTSQRLMEVN